MDEKLAAVVKSKPTMIRSPATVLAGKDKENVLAAPGAVPPVACTKAAAA
jgi:hypothetical protein